LCDCKTSEAANKTTQRTWL